MPSARSASKAWTVIEVKGFGRQKGHTESYRGSGIHRGLSAKNQTGKLSLLMTGDAAVAVIISRQNG